LEKHAVSIFWVQVTKLGGERVYIGFEAERPIEIGQSDAINMGKRILTNRQPSSSLQKGGKGGGGWKGSEIREELAFYRDHWKASCSCS
jgi:hypothetical protein